MICKSRRFNTSEGALVSGAARGGGIWQERQAHNGNLLLPESQCCGVKNTWRWCGGGGIKPTLQTGWGEFVGRIDGLALFHVKSLGVRGAGPIVVGGTSGRGPGPGGAQADGGCCNGGGGGEQAGDVEMLHGEWGRGLQ